MLTFGNFKIETGVAGDKPLNARCCLADAKRVAAEMAKLYGREAAYVTAEDGSTLTIKAAS